MAEMTKEPVTRMTKKEKKAEIAKKEAKLISDNAKVSEAYLVGLMWATPEDSYSTYKETISQDKFVHDVWGFYYELGRILYDDGVKSFDAITVHAKLKELNLLNDFEEFGGMATIDDAVAIVGEYVLNIEHYIESLEKNYILRQHVLLFGDKVLIENGSKYNHKVMSAEAIVSYWRDKVNSMEVSSISNYEVEDLYIDADTFIQRLKEDSAEMLPLYKSVFMNGITQGIPRGNVLMFGGFGGSGKSSISIEKFALSCIANKEKMIVILNEEDAQSFRQKMVLTILWHEYQINLDRKRMANGNLTAEDEDKIRKAFAKLEEMLGADENESGKELIKIVFMEQYVMKDLEKIVRYWANRGYTNLMIDTHKVSEKSEHKVRWETFVEDMKLIYRLTRRNAGGLNLRTWVTFQLADSALNNRFLDYDAIGEGKASKNEAGIVYMFRAVWTDEYAGQAKDITPFRLVAKKGRDKGLNTEKSAWRKEYFDLDPEKTYYLLFTPKNRYGEDNTTGQKVLVIEPHFNSNTFTEIGWAIVANEKGNR